MNLEKAKQINWCRFLKSSIGCQALKNNLEALRASVEIKEQYDEKLGHSLV